MKLDRSPPVQWRTILRHPACFAAFGFGSGLAPVAPGTFGTLVAVPLLFVMAGLSGWAYGLLVGALFALGIWLCGASERILGRHDHSGIVWDEIVGFLIALWGATFAWETVAVGFVVFRFFDVVKPWPIAWLERKIGGGFGIMLDDAIAGLYSWLALGILGYRSSCLSWNGSC